MGQTKKAMSEYAREMGKKGGKARAKVLSPTRRVEIAQMGVEARRAKKEARS